MCLRWAAGLLLLVLRLGLLVRERLLERVDLVGALLVLGIVEALRDVRQLRVDLLERGADRRLHRLGHGRLDQAGRERAEEVDERRVLRVADGELELVDLELDVDDLERVVLAASRLDLDLAGEALAAEEDVGVTRVGEAREARLLLDVCGGLSARSRRARADGRDVQNATSFRSVWTCENEIQNACFETSIVRRICEEDLTRYLSHASALTARERGALMLLRWFAEAGAPAERRYRFFVDREGRARRGLREEAGYEWWFAGGEEARRSMCELDEWEEETRKSEGWS